MEKIKKINENLNLVYDNGLHITLDGKIITSNLYEIGTLSNGLLPLYYENEKKHEGSFSYLDCSTNNIFPIDNVRWISGFHFTGSSLNYIYHNYRTNPLKNLKEYHLFHSKSKDVIEFFEGKKGVSIKKLTDKLYEIVSNQDSDDLKRVLFSYFWIMTLSLNKSHNGDLVQLNSKTYGYNRLSRAEPTLDRTYLFPNATRQVPQSGWAPIKTYFKEIL